jgi:hypothetical protein
VYTERTVTSVEHINTLEEFLISILEEERPNDMLYQEDRVSADFHVAVRVWDVLDRKFRRMF